MWQQRGKVLGGSSSINAMAYIRGHALDYDNWVAMGARGWSYAEVLPYFRKSETYEGGADAYRGDSGPLGVQQGSSHLPLFEAFIQAGVEAGYPRSEDVNGFRQEGFGFCDTTVWEARAGEHGPDVPASRSETPRTSRSEPERACARW